MKWITCARGFHIILSANYFYSEFTSIGLVGASVQKGFVNKCVVKGLKERSRPRYKCRDEERR